MNILILGAGIMQIPGIKIAKEMGHFVLCADGNSNALGKSLCDIFYPVDIKDKEKLFELAFKFHEKHTLHGVFTVGTDFSSTVAWITEKLSLPGISYQSALNATDKVRMRNCFKENGVPSPDFVEYSNEMSLEKAIEHLKFPLVVKPADNMGSRGVQKVNTYNELEKEVVKSLEYSRTSRAVIEEFIDGDEFSLDALIIDGEVKVFGFADREITFPPYFVEMGHTIPSLIDEVKYKEICDVFSKGVKALGLNYGAAKGDVKYSSKGPVIGEIAARLSGGYMSGWTYPFSSGRDLIKSGIELALGLKASILNSEDIGHSAAERAFISIPGIVEKLYLPPTDKIENIERFTTVKEGDRVIFPTNNVEKCGNIICYGSDRDTVVKKAEKYASEIVIRLKDNNWETDQFLFNSKNKKAPKAFDFDIGFLNKLDEDIEFVDEVFYVKKIDKIINSRKKDWQKRTVNQVLKILSEYHKIEFVDDSNCGLDFYKALINGSLQGVLYYLDSVKD